MIQVLKNKIFLGSFIAVLAVFAVFSSKTFATTIGSDNGGSMNPPTLGVLPFGCDLGVGTVYSPMTGESCSIKGGATITPPIVMMPPYDANGCGVGPYSMLTGLTCPGATPSLSEHECKNGAVFSTSVGTKCSGIVPLPPVYDCTVAKNADCARMYDEVCLSGTIKKYDSTDGKPRCLKTNTDGSVKTLPTLTLPSSDVSSTDDVKAIQRALNSVLGSRLGRPLSVDGKASLRTRAAIRLFQKSKGLRSTGSVGPQTLDKLKASFQQSI